MWGVLLKSRKSDPCNGGERKTMNCIWKISALWHGLIGWIQGSNWIRGSIVKDWFQYTNNVARAMEVIDEGGESWRINRMNKGKWAQLCTADRLDEYRWKLGWNSKRQSRQWHYGDGSMKDRSRYTGGIVCQDGQWPSDELEEFTSNSEIQCKRHYKDEGMLGHEGKTSAWGNQVIARHCFVGLEWLWWRGVEYTWLWRIN